MRNVICVPFAVFCYFKFQNASKSRTSNFLNFVLDVLGTRISVLILHLRKRKHPKIMRWKQMKTIGRCCPKMFVRRLEVGATIATVASAGFLSVWCYGALAPGLCME